MKKQILLLAGCAMILASCGDNNASNEQAEKNKMDSIAKANQTMQDELNKKRNDSTINAMAAAKADSIEKATKAADAHKGGSGHKATPPPAHTPTVAPAPAKTAQDNKFDQRSGNQNGTKPTMTSEQQKAQDDKFNRRK